MSQQDTSGPAMPTADPAATPEQDRSVPPAAAPPGGAMARGPSLLSARGWAQEVLVLAGFLAAGVAVTWPRASYLTGRLRLDNDQIQAVWGFWWVARQITHFGNPWFTDHLAAPVGVQLGNDTLMPLLGLVMTPATLVFGPSASYNLLVIVAPGLAAYAMYRAARLWLPSRTGAIAAGAFFGLSAMVASQDWQHLHTAMGCVFLPLTLEAAVRLRRGPTPGRGIVLGVVVGAAVLVDQEAALLAAVLAALVLVPWLARRLGAAGLRAAALGAVTALVIASPQLAAMAQAGLRAGRGRPHVKFAAELPSLFAPSPRLAQYGMTGLASIYRAHTSHELLATFGVVLTLLAALGLIVSWRRPASRKLALLWLGSAALALGPTLYLAGRQYVPLAEALRGRRASLVMPYTWLIQLPGLGSFREADRLALLGLVGAALLAGAAVEWLRRRAWPLIIVVAVLAALEAGLPAPGTKGGVPTRFEHDKIVPTALPALDGPIAADHSGSIVVDVPFVVRGPAVYGRLLAPYSLVLATADSHPRAISSTGGVPPQTIAGIKSHPFYAGLVAAQKGRTITPAHLAAARTDLHKLNVGWVLVWPPHWPVAPTVATKHPGPSSKTILRYLADAGFALDYQADGVMVYRPARGAGSGSSAWPAAGAQAHMRAGRVPLRPLA